MLGGGGDGMREVSQREELAELVWRRGTAGTHFIIISITLSVEVSVRRLLEWVKS